MNFIQVLASCDSDIIVVLGVVRGIITIIQFAIPIILIVLGIMDLSKAVTANDEKATKEAQKRFISRVVYAVVIFLVPYLISLVFNLLPSEVFKSNMGYSWKDCWDAAGK